MSWPVIFRDKRPDKPKVGDLWFARDWVDSDALSEKFKHEAAHCRPPLMIALPSASGADDWVDVFLLDRIPGDKEEGGWDVTIKGEFVDGEPVDINVSPSINCEGSYHGHIRDGVVTDDVEGRTYPKYDKP